MLKELFPGKHSRYAAMSDPTSNDFFFGGFLKSEVRLISLSTLTDHFIYIYTT